ncbi:hypothetical protein [Mesorhizobium shangrilense]|uniref:hypothetical protein n=1 Tax=Mesorhizobium shangrilense TaxID=460060 RepID=UPI003F49370C
MYIFIEYYINLTQCKINILLVVKAAQRLGLYPITLSTDPALYDYLAAAGIEAIRSDKDDVDALIRECSPPRVTYDIAGTVINYYDAVAPATALPRQVKQSASPLPNRDTQQARTRPLRQRSAWGCR